MTISRREWLTATVGGLAGIMLSSGSSASSSQSTPNSVYWAPQRLNAKLAADISYEGFFHKGYGCCFGAFKGIIGQMGDKYGSPYNAFPMQMMEVGKSGISEWGTICGALLGTASAWALFWGRKDRDPMVNELFSWYEKTAFPEYVPVKSLGADFATPKSISDSVLCHVSASKWCYKHRIAMKSKERSERCARLTADVTKRAVEIMNAKINSENFAVTGKSAVLAQCGKCHGPEKRWDIAKGSMDCKVCHSGRLDSMFYNHPPGRKQVR